MPANARTELNRLCAQYLLQALVVFPITIWAGWITQAFLLNTAALVRVSGAHGPDTDLMPVRLRITAWNDLIFFAFSSRRRQEHRLHRSESACLHCLCDSGGSLVRVLDRCLQRLPLVRALDILALRRQTFHVCICCAEHDWTIARGTTSLLRYTLAILWGFLATAVTSSRPGARYIAAAAGAEIRPPAMS